MLSVQGAIFIYVFTTGKIFKSRYDNAMSNKLYLIPNFVSEEGLDVIPGYVARVVWSLRTFFVEDPKSARHLLKYLNPNFPLQECLFFPWNEHTKPGQTQQYLNIIKEKNVGIISESGCPCVADPGADLVFLAHKHDIDVVPLVGPSAILLSLMASGLGGQNFAFNGYLPKEIKARSTKIKSLEKRSFQEKQTQIFMDTPYRNQNVLEDVLKACDDKTFLCVSCDATGTEQYIKTKTIKEWKKAGLQLPKKPALFIISKVS